MDGIDNAFKTINLFVNNYIDIQIIILIMKGCGEKDIILNVKKTRVKK